MDNMNNEVYTNNEEPKTTGKAIECLILGICSIVFSCGGVGIICAIISLVLNGQLTKELGEVPQVAKVGKILSIIGIILEVLVIIGVVISVIVAAAGAASSYSYY